MQVHEETICIAGVNFNFGRLDYGITFDQCLSTVDLDDNLRLSESAKEVYRCLILHLAAGIKCHPFLLQEALRNAALEVKYSKVKVNDGGVRNDALDTLLKRNAYIDIMILKFIWISERAVSE